MFRKILLAVSDSGLREFFYEALHDIGVAEGDVPDTVEARDATDAQRKIDDQRTYGFDLVIIGAEIRAGREKGGDSEGSLGLGLVHQWRAAGLDLPIILLIEHIEHLTVVQTMPDCEAMAIGNISNRGQAFRLANRSCERSLRTITKASIVVFETKTGKRSSNSSCLPSNDSGRVRSATLGRAAMFRKILLAVSDSGLREFFYEALHDIGVAEGDVPDTVEARDATDAQRKIDDQRTYGFDLVIIGAEIRAGREKGGDSEGSLGLGLVHQWRAAGLDLPIILLIEHIEHLTVVQTMPDCEAMAIGNISNDMDKALRAVIQRLRVRAGDASDTRDGGVAAQSELEEMQTNQLANVSARIEIDVNSSYMTYRIHAVRDDQHFEDKNILQIDPRKLTRLVRKTRDLGKRDDWEEELRDIGESLADLFYRKPFRDAFIYTKGLCGPLKNLHIRFTTSKSVYDVAFEALCDNGRYLMLEAPLARKVPEKDTSSALQLGGPKPVNILFIEAAVGKGEYVPELDLGKLETLKNLEAERKYFEDLDSNPARKTALGLKNIEILCKTDLDPRVDDSFRKHLKNVLARDSFDIVHFAGHSVFQDGQGYLVLPGNPPEALKMSTFARWLQNSGTRMAFLSSCKSTDTVAAFELARRGIPAVIGFRWDLDDELAAEFATTFYEQLFGKCSSFDLAFLETRCIMHGDHTSEQIWAAPVLILQSHDWYQHIRQDRAVPTGINVSETG